MGQASQLVVIGCSTGGPAALQVLLPRFPADFPLPVLIVQHMPAGFTASLAERLNRMCPLSVKEAADGDRLQPGYAWVAPAGFQTTLVRGRDGPQLRVEALPSTSHQVYKPSLDTVLASAVDVLGAGVLAVVLTGMGRDGREGCRLVKEAGGQVVVEAATTTVVYGMPRAVAEAGFADEQVPLPDVFAAVHRRLTRSLEEHQARDGRTFQPPKNSV
ncbi:MAG: chemotaxis protein CheB [Alicyclobacillus sp.]|nr:chemotaxis protein CheB [Alicyclobacillus sp.]